MKILPVPKRTAVKIVNTPAQFIKQAYPILYSVYGPQNWWPAKTPFEVIVGAILTQNTNWSNVEKAMDSLKSAKVLTPKKMLSLPVNQLAQYIRSSGYYNQKAIKLKNFLNYFYKSYRGSIAFMKRQEMGLLRPELLSIHGIGPETADSILLYALDKPSFVVDAYTKRILVFHRIVEKKADYHEIRDLFMNSFKGDVSLYNEYHALMVRAAKDYYPTKIKPSARTVLSVLKYQPRHNRG